MTNQIVKVETNNLSSENLISVKELADILNVSDRTIRNTVEKLRNVLSALSKNSQGGYLFNERQATLIKQEIQGHHNLQSRQIDNVSTELEENEIIMKSMAILQGRNEKLREEITRLNGLVEEKDQKLIEQKPKVDMFDKLAGTDNLYSMKQVKDLLQLPYGRNTLFAILRDKGCLNSYNEPYQRYSKYFVYKIIHNDKLNKNIGYTLVTNEGLQYIDNLLKSND